MLKRRGKEDGSERYKNIVDEYDYHYRLMATLSCKATPVTFFVMLHSAMHQ